VPAVIVTGVAKVTCCQPDAVSLANVACASRVPVDDHRLPIWVPVLAAAL
jgi:hypothetical protein